MRPRSVWIGLAAAGALTLAALLTSGGCANLHGANGRAAENQAGDARPAD
jgi:hypothetical protein